MKRRSKADLELLTPTDNEWRSAFVQAVFYDVAIFGRGDVRRVQQTDEPERSTESNVQGTIDHVTMASHRSDRGTAADRWWYGVILFTEHGRCIAAVPLQRDRELDDAQRDRTLFAVNREDVLGWLTLAAEPMPRRRLPAAFRVSLT